MGANCMCYGIRNSARSSTTKRQESRILGDRDPTAPLSREKSDRRSKRSKNVSKQEEAVQESLTAVVTDVRKSANDRRLIVEVLSQHFVFKYLTDEERDPLVEAMLSFDIKSKEILVKEGDSAQNFFIVASGKLLAESALGNRRDLNPKDSFGELALLHGSPRTETVTAVKHSKLWGLDRRTFRQYVESINAKSYEETRRFLGCVSIFQRLTSEQLDSLVYYIKVLSFAPDTMIVREGDIGYEIYILKEGSVKCTEAGSELRRLLPGQYFGEQALLHGGKRTASVTTVEPTICLSLNHDDMKKAFGSQFHQIIFRNTLQIATEKHEFLGKLSGEQRTALISSMEFAHYTSGESVVSVHDPSPVLHIVLRGNLLSLSSQQTFTSFAVLGTGFFELEEGEELPVEEVECSSEDADVAFISKDRFESVLGGTFHRAAQNNLIIKTLKQLPIFHKLNIEQLRELSQALRMVVYREQTVIIQEGSPLTTVFFIQSGKVDLSKEGQFLRTLHRGSPLGEQCLDHVDFSPVNAIAKGEVVTWSFPREVLERLLDEDIKTELKERSLLLANPCTLETLIPIKPLGKGFVGNVYLTYNREQNRLYALKSIVKSRAAQLSLEKPLLLERKILLNLDHHMIMRLYKTFQDSKRVYFLMEYVRSKSFFDVMRDIGLVGEESARFYAACFIEMLNHLHEREVLHRDFKPENILVDEDGYPKLIDFSMSKMVQGRTYTIVGTPYYMAPEVVIGRGYSASADYWSLGVLIYEMTCGYVPFGEDKEDPIEVYELIVAHNLLYPPNIPLSKSIKALIQQLLNANSAMRTAGSITNLQTHSFFSSFPWVRSTQNQLRCRELSPPHFPENLPDLDEEINQATSRMENLDSALYVRNDSDTRNERPPLGKQGQYPA